MVLGSGIKYVQQKIGTLSDNSYSINFAGLYKYNQWIIGVMVQNLVATETRLLDDSELLPLTLKLGINKYLIKELLFSADASYSDEFGKTGYLFGGEYLTKNIFLRAGTDVLNSRYTLGIGFEKEWYKIDYAYVPNKDLGVVHWFTFKILFIQRKKDVISDTVEKSDSIENVSTKDDDENVPNPFRKRRKRIIKPEEETE